MTEFTAPDGFDEQAFARNALDALEDVFYVLTPAGELVYWNDALSTVTGYDNDELAAMSPSAFFAADDRARIEAAIETAIEAGERVTVEATLLTKSGHGVPYEFSGVPVDQDGERIIVGIGREITDRRAFEAQIQRQRNRLSAILENVPVVLFALDDDGVFTHSEGCGLAELGLDAGDVIGQSIFDLYEGSAEILDNVEAALDGAEVREEVTVDGITFDTLYQPVTDDDGTVEYVIGAAVDVTERKRRERELERYEAFVENSQDIITLVDADGIVEYESPAIERILGYDPDELVGDRIFDYIHPDDRARAVERFGRELESPGPTDSIIARFRCRDGSWRWLESVGTNLLETPAIRGIVVTSRDITQRKAYADQLEKRNEQLLVLNRIVRHDIRNDMTVSLGWSELLEDHVDDAGREAVELIQKHDRHVVELTKTVRDVIETLDGDESLECEPIDVASLLERVLETRRVAYGDVAFDVGDVPHVDVVANELLASVFRNVLNNAVQHHDRDDPHVEIDADVAPETVTIRIADDGPGIPDDRKDAVFGRSDRGLDDPASGVGLYLVDTLVGEYGGDVWIEDNEPRGTVVVVQLLRATTQASQLEC